MAAVRHLGKKNWKKFKNCQEAIIDVENTKKSVEIFSAILKIKKKKFVLFLKKKKNCQEANIDVENTKINVPIWHFGPNNGTLSSLCSLRRVSTDWVLFYKKLGK